MVQPLQMGITEFQMVLSPKAVALTADELLKKQNSHITIKESTFAKASEGQEEIIKIEQLSPKTTTGSMSQAEGNYQQDFMISAPNAAAQLLHTEGCKKCYAVIQIANGI